MRFLAIPLVVVCAPLLLAQSALPTEFEVATIRPHKEVSENSRIRLQPGGRVEASNVTLRRMIVGAYDVTDQQLVDAPSWVNQERWDLEAQAEGLPANVTPEMMFPLLRKLLEDRFHLKVRREMREMPVYQLLVDRGGPKLKLTTTEGLDGANTSAGPKGIKVDAVRLGMQRFSQMMSSRVGRAVVDRTGLSGRYDFTLEWVPEMAATATGDGAPAGPSVFTALRETLGLRLESGRDMVEVLVVESVARPTEN
jgi:uncharacterized protein (TIGR03435 family)